MKKTSIECSYHIWWLHGFSGLCKWIVGHYPNGYNQFSYDITDYLHKDGRENVVAVHATQMTK